MALSGRAQLVAHGGEEARLGHAGGLGAAPRLVGDGLLALDLGDQRVLLGAELQHGKRRGVEAPGQDDEVDMQADGDGGHGEIEGVALGQEAGHHGQRDGDGAGAQDAHHRRGERHADGEQDDQAGQHEDVAGGVGRAEPHRGDAGPGDAVGQLQPEEPAAPAGPHRPPAAGGTEACGRPRPRRASWRRPSPARLRHAAPAPRTSRRARRWPPAAAGSRARRAPCARTCTEARTRSRACRWSRAPAGRGSRDLLACSGTLVLGSRTQERAPRPRRREHAGSGSSDI